MKGLNDKSFCHWLIEKYFLNYDCISCLVRSNHIPAILIDGYFRESFNIFVCITVNPNKTPMVQNIQKDNGRAVSFMLFIMKMTKLNRLQHNELSNMNNETIHKVKEADKIKDLLWNTKIDGNPIHLKEHTLHFGLNK